MKTLSSALLAVCLASVGGAQPSADPAASSANAPVATPSASPAPKRSVEDMEKLLAPIALYPDALVAIILPAATNSADIVLAARLLMSNPGESTIDQQPWDESVKSLARYPEVVKWMDENLSWTRDLGEAFALQPVDMMNTLQKLRKDAKAKGLLADTPEQKVVVRDDAVSIVPAQEDVIYVPYYDPTVLLVERPRYDSWLSFSVGFAAGSWLYYDLDWPGRTVVTCRRSPGWAYRPDWRYRERIEHRHVDVRPWRPAPGYWRHVQESPRGYHPVQVIGANRFITPARVEWNRPGDRHEPRRRGDRNYDQRPVEAWSQPGQNRSTPPPNSVRGTEHPRSERSDGRWIRNHEVNTGQTEAAAAVNNGRRYQPGRNGGAMGSPNTYSIPGGSTPSLPPPVIQPNTTPSVPGSVISTAPAPSSPAPRTFSGHRGGGREVGSPPSSRFDGGASGRATPQPYLPPAERSQVSPRPYDHGPRASAPVNNSVQAAPAPVSPPPAQAPTTHVSPAAPANNNDSHPNVRGGERSLNGIMR